MSDTDNASIDVVNRFNDGINAQDSDALAALMTDDHSFVDTAGSTVTGKDACIRVWQSFFAAFPDYRNTFDELRVHGDVVAVRGRSHCHAPELDGPALWRARVQAGLVREWRVYVDDADTRRALKLE